MKPALIAAVTILLTHLNAFVSADVNAIQAEKDCYETDDAISIKFAIDQAESDDWIGIYWESADTDALAEPLMFLWTCGTQRCRGIVPMDTLTFGDGAVNHALKWPLMEGKYIAVIARNSRGPYQAFAVSYPFTVASSCGSSPMPSMRLPPFPSITPSSAPTNTFRAPPVSDSITTDETCYSGSDAIVASFESDASALDSWVGIYEATVNTDALRFPLLWLWTCGTQEYCTDAVKSGFVAFSSHGPDGSGIEQFPLKQGSYKALLILRNGAAPRRVVAESPAFEISASCVTDAIPRAPVDKVSGIIRAAALQGGVEFEDPESYQSRALTATSQFNNTSLEDMEDEEIIQMYALLCIYFATNGVETGVTNAIFGAGLPPSWAQDTYWTSDSVLPCSGWHGVACNPAKRVTTIELSENRLTGSFPAEVTLIDSLEYLDLYTNFFWNKGDEGNSWLGDLGGIEYLFYGNTYFEYPGIPTEISMLTNLREYDASYTRYYGPLVDESFEGLVNLEYLSIGGNAYNSSIPPAIGRLPSLSHLHIEDAYVEGNLDFAVEMPSIQEMWLHDNPGLSGTLPSALHNLQSLSSLDVSGCGLTGSIPSEFGLFNADAFNALWLFGNQLTGTIPPELGNLSQLVRLELEANKLTGAVPTAVCRNSVPLGFLTKLEVDCDGEIECSCCTCCGEDCAST